MPDSENVKKLPANLWTLADLRNAHNLSMAGLARLIGVTPATVWQWEQKGKNCLRQKQINQLLTVFTESEVDSLLHPEEYFDAEGNPIKEIDHIGEVPERDPEPQPEEEEEEETPAEPVQEEPAGLSSEQVWRMIKEINLILMLLSDEGKERLVQYADWLYQYENGMRLPSVSGAGAINFEKMWREQGITPED